MRVLIREKLSKINGGRGEPDEKKLRNSDLEE